MIHFPKFSIYSIHYFFTETVILAIAALIVLVESYTGGNRERGIGNRGKTILIERNNYCIASIKSVFYQDFSILDTEEQ